MVQVIPATIPKNKSQLEEEIKIFSDFADLVQVDICDGVFTSEKTWPYNGNDQDFFEDLKKENVGWPQWENVDIEVHLMVQNPENIVSDFIKTGVSSIVVHIESTNDFQKIIDICRLSGVRLSVAIKPSSNIALLEQYQPQIDSILCMGSDKLGKHGTELEEKAIDQIKKLRATYPDSIIGVDIGVNLETKDVLLEAGVNKLISGSAILDSDNPKEMFEELSK